MLFGVVMKSRYSARKWVRNKKGKNSALLLELLGCCSESTVFLNFPGIPMEYDPMLLLLPQMFPSLSKMRERSCHTILCLFAGGHHGLEPYMCPAASGVL